MTVTPLKISDAFLINFSVYKDLRGAFEPLWESSDFAEKKILFNPNNANHSYNVQSGILRGMHYQLPPFQQSKLVSCVSGVIYDVIVDLRANSNSYRQWFGVKLSAACGISVLIPGGCAHGFVTLEPNSTISYLIEGAYHPEATRVLRWNDPSIGISWPITAPIMSEQDRNAPDFTL